MSSQVDERPKTNGHLAADPSLRTYRGRSLEEVLPQIRTELGPDAVVVRQREGLMGGIGGFFQQQFVEVQARAGSRRIDLYDEEPALPAPLPQPAAAAEAATAREPVAPAPSPAPAPAKPAGQLSAAELLRQATGGAAGETRTPAEILREHSDTFARQLAAAEERAEPVVSATRPAPAEPSAAPRATYPPGRNGAPADEPIPLPQKPAPAPAPEPDLPPAAEMAPAVNLNGTAAAAGLAPVVPVEAAPVAAPAPAPAAAKPAVRRPAKRRASARRAAARAAARAPRAARAPAKARAAAAKAAPKPKAAAEPAPAPALVDDPEPFDGGVGPQTTQALELAAAIAASVGAERAPATAAAPVAGPALPPAAPAGTGAAPAAPAAPLRPALPAAPRRSLFGRRRRYGATAPRVSVGGPEAAAVTDALAQRGLEQAASAELLLDATAHVLPFTPGSDVRTAVRAALARRIPVPPQPRIGGRTVAFVGAGGGGKTRCTAGLAAAYAQGSTIPVACLTLAPADGGAELTALLKPHGVRVEAVATAEQATKRLAELRAAALVVIDTPAVSPSDPDGVAALAAQLAQLELDETQLVVPATLSAAVAAELVERLAPLEPTAMVMTHADATEHIGAVVELSCATRLPLSYVNGGLDLPGALAPADPLALAERLLP
jgi:flagellar biosynthesis GTPase FlhF